jgi:hypothetical protein
MAYQQPDRDLRGDDLAGGRVGEAGRDTQAKVESGIDPDLPCKDSTV